MYNFVTQLKYKLNGNIIIENSLENQDTKLDFSVTDDKIICKLNANKKIELISFVASCERKFATNEVFYANGYQSWTTSREYSKDDTMNGMTKIADISEFTKGLAGISGDYHFETYGKKGLFHSYTYSYIRYNKKVELFGSLNERTGYTIFEVNFPCDSFSVKKDVEGAVVEGEYELLNVVRFIGEYEDVFDKYFSLLNLRKPKINHLSGYTSWYNYFQKIDENIILRDLDGLDRAKDDVSIFQIDDGYESYVGDWLVPNAKKFPHGMKPIAERIHDKGYLAGIWIAPFSAQIKSVVAKSHPDWLIKNNKNGKPLLGCVGWGGAYTFDIYNDEAREYIRNFFDVILNDWGFDMVKLDFLYSEAMQPRNGKSRGQIMCEAMDFLRECVGDEKLILGCGVPLGPSFGVVDACRISCDVDLKYEGKFYNAMGINQEIPSAQNAINNSIFRRHLNQRVFCNDPDVFFLRENNLTFTMEQKILLGKINNMCGDVLFVSDNAGDYGEKEIELLKKFFKKTECRILSAEFLTNEDLVVEYEENGKKNTLRFNIKTGKNNLKISE